MTYGINEEGVIFRWIIIIIIIIIIIVVVGGRCSVVGIATGYGLKVRGLNSFGDDIFRTRPDWPQVPPPPQKRGGQFPRGGGGGSGRGFGVNHPRPSSAEVKERVDLYFYPFLCIHCLM